MAADEAINFLEEIESECEVQAMAIRETNEDF